VRGQKGGTTLSLGKGDALETKDKHFQMQIIGGAVQNTLEIVSELLGTI